MRRRPGALLLVLALLLTAAGCGLAAPGGSDAEPRVTILGPWTDEQERQFKDVLDGFGIPYTYQGTAATREVLLAEVQAGNPPDIAILPGVGELVEYAADNRLKPLTGLYDPGEYGNPWLPEAEGIEKDLWVPLKVDLKSIVWYREGETPRPPRPPGRLVRRHGRRRLLRLARQRLDRGPAPPAGGPGAVRALGHRRPALDRPAGRHRLDHLGGPARPGLARGAPGDPDEGPPRPAGGHGLLFDGGGCSLEHQGSFARSFYGDRRAGAAFTDSAPLLPGGSYTVKAHEVSADFAALFGDGEQARTMIRRLTSEKAQEEWGREGGVFSANSAVPARKGAVEREVGRRLTDQWVPLCLDASDVMPAAVRDAFYEAVLLTVAHPDEPVLPRLKDIQKVQDAQLDRVPRLTGVCGRPQ